MALLRGDGTEREGDAVVGDGSGRNGIVFARAGVVGVVVVAAPVESLVVGRLPRGRRDAERVVVERNRRLGDRRRRCPQRHRRGGRGSRCRDLEPDAHCRHAVLHFMVVGKSSVSGDWKPGLGIPVAECVVHEDRRFLHHDGGSARDALVHVSGDPELLSGLKEDTRVIGLHLPVDRSRE